MMDETSIPLVDVIDLEILMHRDIHFGGNFDVMIDYYQNDGVGVMPDFSLKRIRELKEIEDQMGQNLSELLLPSPAKETVEDAKKIYLDLRDVYEQQHPSPISLYLSNLILSEEENPKEEMQHLIRLGNSAAPHLINLIRSHSFYDPLYPGYGRAPLFAVKCLAEIGDENAIPALFESLGQENFYIDDTILSALHQFGDKAKHFLLKALKKMPLSKDNDHAAIALLEFEKDPEVLHAFLDLLSQEAAQKRPSFAPYLVFGCSNLLIPEDQQTFKQISKSPHITKELLSEMHSVIEAWKKRDDLKKLIS